MASVLRTGPASASPSSADVVRRIMQRVPPAVVHRLRNRVQPDGALGASTRAVAAIGRHAPIPVDEFTPWDAPDLHFVAADSHILRRIYWAGIQGYEGSEPAWWAKACARHDAVLELGANVGVYTVIGATAAGPSTTYTALEPHPVSAAVTRTNLARNGLDHVDVVEAAVVPHGGPATVTLDIPAVDHYGTPAGAFVAAGAEAPPAADPERTITVDARSIRSLITDVDLVKLDIEGLEAAVLRDVLDDVTDRRPTLFVEVRRAAVPDLRRVLVDLRAVGYAVHAIGRRSLHVVTDAELGSADPLPRYGSRDLLLTSSGQTDPATW